MEDINDLLDMSLREVTDTLLQETDKRSKQCCRVKFPGCTRQGERILLTVVVKYESD